MSTEQDAVTFTGSAATGQMLKESQAIVENSVRFNMEADSLNCSMLGPDAAPGTEEFELFIKEVVREMTIKAGQKCTAIRRTIVPAEHGGGCREGARSAGSAKTTIGDPAWRACAWGPREQGTGARRRRQRRRASARPAELVFGGGDFSVVGADRDKGAFFGPDAAGVRRRRSAAPSRTTSRPSDR